MSNRTYLYIRKGMEQVYKKFREIADREGRSPSKILMDLIEEYVRRHEPGNPQLLLQPFMEGVDSRSKPPLCRAVVKLERNQVYCSLRGYAWVRLEECWRCFQRGGR